ncbi:MAG: glycosyltransferase family 4 protein [Chloroflexota bacterium]|nr:glycosyltransferase family 4 protein [Chloroflexota bacterium]
MRIALIGPVTPRLGGATPGGVATHQVHLAAGLAQAGVYAPLLATNTRSRPGASGAREAEAPFPLYRMGRPEHARGQYLLAVGAQRAACYALQLAFSSQAGSRREVLANLLWYRRFLAQVRPEVIHVQHPLERSVYARRVRRLEGWKMPLVVTAHSLFGEHSESTIERVMAPNLRAADWVIAVSAHIADQAMQLGVEASRLTVIRSAVDIDQFRPRARGDRVAARQTLGIAAETPLVLFVGNLEPRKQVDVLLKAMACVRKAVPDAAVVIVGSGESAGVQDQTARLARLTQDLGLAAEDGVRFVGRVAEAQLLEYYAAADVFALPSSAEAQGIVALEAMACGLPVVASAVGGLLGTIDDGHTGFLVPSGDVPALADRLLRLLTEPSQRSGIGAAARQTVEREFSWKRTVEATLGVYREVLGRP